ncbi:fumarylacetoacetate hydrolase family protein [Nocardia jiangxiensis]|uniref:Fumarylacetoacetate hydrolase family protein n=1 Tax=Nocardia jiangxiensis TaxID=282685 RepID=A0ABW6RX53_9NOCA
MRYGTVRLERRRVLVASDGTTWRKAGDGTSLLDVIGGARPSWTPLGRDPVETEFALPYRPPTIFGIGLNYRDTVREMGWDTPKVPYLFPKLSSSAIGPADDIVVDTALTTRVDWEAELGVVIGTRCRNIDVSDAMGVVFGYIAANDISARDLQAEDGQWVRGKGLDTFCPLGPLVVTADEVVAPQAIGIRTRRNGTLVQDGTTADMIFTVPELISYCSRFFTLHPGDVILTGTPAGSGDARTPRISLRPGDTIEIEVEGIGQQRNTVVGR